MTKPHLKSLALLASSIVSAPAFTSDGNTDANEKSPDSEAEVIVITGVRTAAPLTVTTDTKKPRQPLPAHDGADYLKTIPGFNVVRKGGSDGDPSFRSMAGSRLNILVDGGNVLGGCNFRMDAPTAYIFPEMFDQLTIVKGPQSVMYGPGSSAGTVMFERKPTVFTQADITGYVSGVLGSFNRRDLVTDLRAGDTYGYAQLTGSFSEANNFSDGNGVKVHSQYQRYNGTMALAWTPTENSTLEVSFGQSDGEAAYADRGMDGTKFLRESVGVSFKQKEITNWLNELAFVYSDASVDHIMDDQTLRTPGMMGYANLLRDTESARLTGQLNFLQNHVIDLGVDWGENDHHSRTAPPSGLYSALKADGHFEQYGFFAEYQYQVTASQKIITGFRNDHWQAKDLRTTTGGMMPMPNPTFGATRDESLNSGFARYEFRPHASTNTWFIGVGQSSRFPDYWELFSKESDVSRSAFDTKEEITKQLDIGVVHQHKDLQFSASLFTNKVEDYILIDYANPMKRGGYSRNIDANSWGGEIDLKRLFLTHWSIEGSVAYTRGENETDDEPLAQTSPLELRVGLNYAKENWSFGSILRWVDEQDRFHLNRGTIVGKDLGPSDDFTVFSINGGWKPNALSLLSVGIDNLFDETYAEFISRAGGNGMGGSIPGFVQTMRVNEPGRVVWAKLTIEF